MDLQATLVHELQHYLDWLHHPEILERLPEFTKMDYHPVLTSLLFKLRDRRTANYLQSKATQAYLAKRFARAVAEKKPPVDPVQLRKELTETLVACVNSAEDFGRPVAESPRERRAYQTEVCFLKQKGMTVREMAERYHRLGVLFQVRPEGKVEPELPVHPYNYIFLHQLNSECPEP